LCSSDTVCEACETGYLWNGSECEEETCEGFLHYDPDIDDSNPYIQNSVERIECISCFASECESCLDETQYYCTQCQEGFYLDTTNGINGISGECMGKIILSELFREK
jgi:hypothetical protein